MSVIYYWNVKVKERHSSIIIIKQSGFFEEKCNYFDNTAIKYAESIIINIILYFFARATGSQTSLSEAKVRMNFTRKWEGC